MIESQPVPRFPTPEEVADLFRVSRRTVYNWLQKEALAYRKRVRCKNIFFVEGNHDGGTRKISGEFGWWKQLAEVKTHDQVIVLCHYAMRVWHHSFRGSWHLYGHSHGRLPDDPAALSMDVGVDTHEFRPWHFDEIKERMEEKASRLKRAKPPPSNTCGEGVVTMTVPPALEFKLGLDRS